MVTNVARVAARKQAIVSSQSALKATQAGYEVGTRNLVDLLEVQSNLYQSKRNYSNALFDYISGLLSLKLAAGTLNPGDIEQLNSYLNTSKLTQRNMYSI